MLRSALNRFVSTSSGEAGVAVEKAAAKAMVSPQRGRAKRGNFGKVPLPKELEYPKAPIVTPFDAKCVHLSCKKDKNGADYMLRSLHVHMNSIRDWQPVEHELRLAVEKMPLCLSETVGKYLREGYAFGGMNKFNKVVMVKSDSRYPYENYALPRSVVKK